jgi:gas vesicle protein
MSDSGDGAISFFAGFLFGGIIGAGIALLMAPQSGPETREQLKTTGIELKGRAEEYANIAQERAEEVSERGKIVLAQRKEKLAAAVEEGKSVAAKTRKELQAKLAAAKAEAGPTA